MPWVKGQSGNPVGTNGTPDQLGDVPPITEWTAVAIMRRPPPDAIITPRIAAQARGNPGCRGPRWLSVEDAPLTYQQARALVAAGLLLAANRITDAGTEYVVKTPRLAMQRQREVA